MMEVEKEDGNLGVYWALVSRPQPARRVLMVTHRGRTTAFDLGGKTTVVIGRSSTCDVFLDENSVSRRHAVFHVHPDRIEIEDLGSQNGTLLLGAMRNSDDTQTARGNETRLAPNQITPLGEDKMILIGTALLTLQVSSGPRTMDTGVPGMLVADPAMHRVLDLADRAAPTNLTVLLLGESGTGKEMVARYVHEHSPRRTQRMVSLNCGALPETLLESELFGYEKGAFTGATGPKQGLFEAADGGTLFLDEVGELPPSLQVKLLRVLEDRKVLRVGAVEPRIVDVRFIAATNIDLEAKVAEGKFREDLYYRLYGIPVFIPPLRERREDIIPLAERFLAEADLGHRRGLSDAAKEKLCNYDWPGNVRQLKNVLNRAVVMASGRDISPDDIDLRDRDVRPAGSPIDEAPEVLRQRAEDAEKRRILEALDECAGNQTRAAQRLGITRRALVRRLEKYNVPRPRRDAREARERDED